MRCGWRNAAWRDAAGEPFDMIAALCEGAEPGLIDRPIWVRRRDAAPPLALRLVAVKKAPQAAEAARRTARREAQKRCYGASGEDQAALSPYETDGGAPCRSRMT